MEQNSTETLNTNMMKRYNYNCFEEILTVLWQAFVPLDCPKGSCVLLHGSYVHMSKENNSNISRHAYSLHFIEGDGSVKYESDNWYLPPSFSCSKTDNVGYSDQNQTPSTQYSNIQLHVQIAKDFFAKSQEPDILIVKQAL